MLYLNDGADTKQMMMENYADFIHQCSTCWLNECETKTKNEYVFKRYLNKIETKKLCPY